MQYEAVGLFNNGPPVVVRGVVGDPEDPADMNEARRGHRVLVRIMRGFPATILVDVLFTKYDFAAREVAKELQAWHAARRLEFRGWPEDTYDRAHWIRAETSATDSLDAMLEVILQACQRTRRWTGNDQPLVHMTKEGLPL